MHVLGAFVPLRDDSVEVLPDDGVRRGIYDERQAVLPVPQFPALSAIEFLVRPAQVFFYALAVGIVKQSGGDIWVYSEPNRGTTFKIYLPSAEHKLGVAAETQAEALPPRREGVTILLAEDDVVMRRLTRKMLEEHGYTVLEADNGTSALDAIGSDHAAIDLVLTDVVMKGMTGPELVLRLIEAHPEMKVVYMSGYTGELVTRQGLESGIRLLEKPFTRADLLKTIDAALG